MSSFASDLHQEPPRGAAPDGRKVASFCNTEERFAMQMRTIAEAAKKVREALWSPRPSFAPWPPLMTYLTPTCSLALATTPGP